MKKIVILFTSLLLLSCSSDDNTNSNPIPTGSDTVSFNFNDTEFSTTNKDQRFEKAHVYVSPTGSLIVFKLENDVSAVELSISTNVALEEGKTYDINSFQTANFSARIHYFGNHIPSQFYATNNEIGGSISILKIDYQKQIIAATFNYNAVDEKGNIQSIRNGWFDFKF